MKRKLLTLLLLLAMTLLAGAALADEADWSFDAEYYFMRGYTGQEDYVIMPSWLQECPVEVLVEGILKDRQEIEVLALSENLMDLRAENICGNINLRKVMLPQSLIIIGDNNFRSCGALTEVTVPAQVSYVGAGCFSLCSGLEKVTFEGVCPVFGPRCFEDNAANLVILVPDDQLESYRAALPGLDVRPSGSIAPVQSFISDEYYYDVAGDVVNSYAGYETRVEIPASFNGVPVTTIGDYSFPMSAYISYITVPEGVTSIGAYAFSDMDQLVHVTLPGTLKSIGECAFRNFRGYSITLPEGLEEIGPYAFLSARLEGTLVLPSTLRSVSPDFLMSCYGVTRLVVKGDPRCLPPDLLDYYPFLEIVLAEDATEEQRLLMSAYLHGAPEMTIVTQPQDAAAARGETAQVSVTALGDGLQYAWYVARSGSAEFLPVEQTGAEYACVMDESTDGCRVYCVVTDLYGSSLTSATATLRMVNELRITSQPQSLEVAEGEWAEVSVTAEGDGLSYAWYVMGPWDGDFTLDSSAVDSVYSVLVTLDNSGTQVYCVVTDRNGCSVTTERAYLNLAADESWDEDWDESDDEEEYVMPEPVPVGAAGEPFLGVWTLQRMEIGEMVFMASEFGMEMKLTFAADGTVCIVEDGEENVGVWFVVDGAVLLDELVLTILPTGELAASDGEGAMIFTRTEEAAPAAPAGDGSAAMMDTRMICRNYTASGFTLDASTLGAAYELTLHEGGTADMVLAGVAVTGLPFSVAEDGSYVIDYYGMQMICIPTTEGFDLDYFGAMTMHFVPAQ